MMDVAFALVRAIHTAALVALFGRLVFALWVAAAFEVHAREPNGTRLRASAAWVALAFASGVAWLALEAVSMSGLPIAQALGYENLSTVLTQTEFGRVWIWRGVLLLLFAAGLLVTSSLALVQITRVVLPLLAAALLTSLALVGHANAERGIAKAVHLSADALHLLAAGGWLGALWPFAAMLATTEQGASGGTIDQSARAAQRFSLLGIASVCTIVVTGAVNAWFTVASLSALLMTDYGHLLLIKVALFAGMFAFAVVNRTLLTPTLAQTDLAGDVHATALNRLRRNAVMEFVLGFVILGIAGVLGTSMPAADSRAMAPSMHTP